MHTFELILVGVIVALAVIVIVRKAKKTASGENPCAMCKKNCGTDQDDEQPPCPDKNDENEK